MTVPHVSDADSPWAVRLTAIIERLDAASARLRTLVAASDTAPWRAQADAALADQADALGALRAIIAEIMPLDEQVWQPPLRAATRRLKAFFWDSPRLHSVPLPIQQAMLDVLAIVDRTTRQLGQGTLPQAETKAWIVEISSAGEDTTGVQLVIADCGQPPLLRRVWVEEAGSAQLVDTVARAGGVCHVDDSPEVWTLSVRFDGPLHTGDHTMPPDRPRAMTGPSAASA